MFEKKLISDVFIQEEIMETIINWIIKNKEWIFSGIGITIITLAFIFIKRIKRFVICFIKRIRYIIEYPKGIKGKGEKTYDDSVFISEYPSDGISIPVGERFKKSWTIKNDGNVIWEKRTLRCIEYANGYFYPVNKIIRIPTTYPGQIITLNVEYEVTAEGDYSSKWKMYDRKNNLIYPHKSIGLGVNIMARKK